MRLTEQLPHGFLRLSYTDHISFVPAWLGFLLLYIASADQRRYEIPDKSLVVAFCGAVLLSLLEIFLFPQSSLGPAAVVFRALQTLVILIAMWLFWHANTDGLGYGDLKLLVVLGAFVPIVPWMIMLLVACVFALITYACARLSLWRAGFAESKPPLPIAFAPCIAVAWFLMAAPDYLSRAF